MNPEKKYVWYACYGSNLLRERFLLYVQGGTIVINGKEKSYDGCRDTSEPSDDRPYILNHRLYFAGSSRTWGGGVAFVESRNDEVATTFGRIYKITEEQLLDVREQEGSGEIWYGNKMLIGTVDGLPVYTLTRASRYDWQGRSQPTEAYLRVIAEGLAEAHPGVNAGEYLMCAIREQV